MFETQPGQERSLEVVKDWSTRRPARKVQIPPIARRGAKSRTRVKRQIANVMETITITQMFIVGKFFAS